MTRRSAVPVGWVEQTRTAPALPSPAHGWGARLAGGSLRSGQWWPTGIAAGTTPAGAAEGLRLWGVEAITAPVDVEIPAARSGRRPLFRDHLAKHVLAAMSGALINARLDRVLGTEFVTQFLDDAEAGRLEGFRQGCLYLGWQNGALHVPAESITSEQGARYVALSGEVLAEIQPEPGAWSRVLERVKEFEESAGIESS